MNKGKRLLWVLHHSKPLWALFSLVFSLLLIVGSTYAWVTYSDERVNRTSTNRSELSAHIAEEFQPNFAFAPGTKTDKELTVVNNGEVPAIVRLSLFEFFLSFDINLDDGEDAGNVKVYKDSEVTGDYLTADDVQFDDPADWDTDSKYYLDSDRFFFTDEFFASNVENSATAYQYKGTAAHEGLSYISIDFNESKIFTADPGSSVTDYWYFEDGYFYYSEVLQPNEETEPLIHSVSLSADYPNKYKGALYKLIPVMDGHDISQSLLTDWGLTSGHYSYAMYEEKVQ